MLEMMMGKPPSSSNYYPNSGPGTKTLQFGTPTLGYFGEVSGTELFFGWEIGQAVGLQAGGDYTIYAGSQWFKFFRNNKVIYISRQQVKAGLTWTDLYNSGLVYGTKGNGLYPVGAGVEQFNPMRKNDGSRDWYLKPRLMTGMGTDPIAGATGDGGEWNQLFGRLVVGTNTGVAEKWVSNTVAYVSSSGPNQLSSMVMETNTNDVTQSWNRGGSNDLTLVASNSKTTSLLWRPVLELVAADVLMNPSDVTGTLYGLQPPTIVDARSNVSGSGTVAPLLDPVNVTTLWPTKQPVITSFVFTGSAIDPANVVISGNVGLNAFTASASPSQLAYDPTNLSYSLAQLNPFTISGTTT